MDNIQTLLNEVNVRVHGLQVAKELYSEQLAPDFLVFDYLNTYETGLSKILADLLNPNGTHGQKTLFLENFIKICLPNIYYHPDNKWQNYLDNLAITCINTEETTFANQSCRRMDIYLSAKIANESFGLCIENKPYADDQINQLSDYYKELENRNVHHKHIVYLCEAGEPSEKSVKADELAKWKSNQEFSHVSYTQLIDWLTDCKKYCQNQSVSEFLIQFVKFIQKQFIGIKDMTEQNEIAKIIQKNPDSILSAMKINIAIAQMKADLINEFILQLKSKSQNKAYHIETDGIDPNKRYQNIQFKIDGLSDFDIRIQFENTNYAGFFIGIYTLDENQIHSKKYQNINKTIQNNEYKLQLVKDKVVYTQANMWCIWYDLEPTHWDRNPEVWANILKGTLSDAIIGEVDTLYKILKDNQLFN